MPQKSLNYTLLSQSEVEANSFTNSLRVVRKKWSTRDYLKWALPAVIIVALGIALIVNSTRRSRGTFDPLPDGPNKKLPPCPQYPAFKTESEDHLKLEQAITDELTSSGFFDESLKRMQGAVQIPTESFDDMGPVGEDSRWDIFNEFHDYLEKTFPQIWSKLEITKVNTYGLIITWKGSDDSLKPYLFMAHQDVVPVPEATVKRWTYEPFSAHYDGRFVWGRGSADCKNNLIGVLEAIESLLSKDFKPERTILAGFGFDEEISGFQGALYISEKLEETWGKDGLELIIDEGGLGIKEVAGATFALPGLGEKGYLDALITVETPGGHSSTPTDHTGIGLLARIITVLEDAPYSAELTPANPYFTTLQCLAEYGNEMDKWQRKKIKEAFKDKKAAQEVADYLDKNDISQRYLLKTSQAVDIINGGVKVNALPEKVYAVVNHRIAFESSVKDTQEHMKKLLEDKILSQFDLSLDAWGSGSSDSNTSEISTGRITLSTFDKEPLEPSPVSPFDSDAYKLFSGTIKQVLGESIIVAPASMTGNTDTKYYWDLSRNIYRFTPVREGGRVGMHTVDEHVGMREHVEGVRFYAQIILNGGGGGDKH